MAGTMSPEAWQAYLAEDSSWLPFRCSIAAIAVVTVAYAGRFWARSLQAAPFGWFDIFMIPAFLATVATSVCGILVSLWGTGRHLELFYYGSDYAFDRWGLLTYYITANVYMGGIIFPRLSILCLYGRLFRDKTSQAIIWFVVVLMAGRLIGEAVVLYLQCDKLSNAWHEENWPTHCSEDLLQHYAYGRIPNVVIDVIMLILPLPTLWRLKLSMDVRIGLCATFCIGSFGLVTAAIGLVAFLQGMHEPDQSWANSPMITWSVLEPAAYFTSACMLTYKPLIRAVTKSSSVRSVYTWCTTHMGYDSSMGRSFRTREPSTQFPKALLSPTAFTETSTPTSPATPYTPRTPGGMYSPTSPIGPYAPMSPTGAHTPMSPGRMHPPMSPGEMRRHPIHPAHVPVDDRCPTPTSTKSAASQDFRCGTCVGCVGGEGCNNRQLALSYYLNV